MIKDDSQPDGPLFGMHPSFAGRVMIFAGEAPSRRDGQIISAAAGAAAL